MPSLRLTPREVQVLDLVKLGYQDKRIAEEMGISPRTVRIYLQLIFTKLEAVNRVDAVVKALRAGYISLEVKDGR